MKSKTTGLLAGLVAVLVTVLVVAGTAGVGPRSTEQGVTRTPTHNTVTVAATGDTTATATTVAAAPPTATALPVAPSPSVRAPGATPQGQAQTQRANPSPTPVSASTAALEPSATVSMGGEQIIGHSVQGRPIFAHRIGEGALKVVLVGDIHGAFEANTHDLLQQLLQHFRTSANEVPANVSLWLIPTMNPDGLATGHRWNANDVDLNRNADTDLDGCAGNDWSPDTVGHEGTHPGAGGPYPFSEPEARAVRDFLQDAWVAVFYHSAADAIFLDTCQRHPPTRRLAEALSDGTGYPVPAEGWAGYPVTGDFGDYLAGEGVAAVTVELQDHEDPEFDRNLAGVRSLLGSVEEIVSAEAREAGADQIWLDDINTGAWRYAERSYLHPLGLQIIGDRAYLLDGGRILATDVHRPAATRLLLEPGDDVGDVRVLEPMELATHNGSLLVLDRAGDVYRFDPAQGQWTVARYDRPPGATSDHYYVALDTAANRGYLLETSHEQVWRFPVGAGAREKGSAWLGLPKSRDVDLSAKGSNLYVLARGLNSPQGTLLLYRDGRQVPGFQPKVGLIHPRQVLATDTIVFVLDRAGRRLLALDPQTGALLALTQFSDRRAVSVMWADPTGERVVLAGQDTLYFVGQPDQQTVVEGEALLAGPQPHDPGLLEGLRGLLMPIEGARVTSRDFQMPGAPRHYRLGVHEGLDFYGHTVGVPVNRKTEVRAVEDGTVIRALVDHQRLTAAQANAWATQSRSLGYTPPEVLDGYRGMQVWIAHEGDVVSRYAHLGSIAPGIAEGSTVSQGQVIGTVGNSGTPGSVDSQTYDVHLHLELWVGGSSAANGGPSGGYVGQYLRPIEARGWLERILR